MTLLIIFFFNFLSLSHFLNNFSWILGFVIICYCGEFCGNQCNHLGIIMHQWIVVKGRWIVVTALRRKGTTPAPIEAKVGVKNGTVGSSRLLIAGEENGRSLWSPGGGVAVHVLHAPPITTPPRPPSLGPTPHHHVVLLLPFWLGRRGEKHVDNRMFGG